MGCRAQAERDGPHLHRPAEERLRGRRAGRARSTPPSAANAALSAIAQGDDAAAEKHLRASIEAAKQVPQATLGEQLRSADELIWLSYVLARQGRSAEARGLIGPVLAIQRSLQQQVGNDDQFQRRALVLALAAAAAAEPASAKALLDEAQAQHARLTAEMRSLNSTVFIAQRMAEVGRSRP